jgi:hypothetical protein
MVRHLSVAGPMLVCVVRYRRGPLGPPAEELSAAPRGCLSTTCRPARSTTRKRDSIEAVLLPKTSSLLVGADAWVRPMLCAMAAGRALVLQGNAVAW